MRQIREWLEKKGSYAAGLALYETHGKSRVVLKSLRHGESEFTRATLRRELEKILAGDVTATVTAAPPVGVAPSLSAAPVKADELVAEQRRTWFATRAHLHAQLELVGSDQARRDLAGDILALVEKIDASYRPQPPAEKPAAAPLPLDAGEQRRQLANLRALASKLKKNPARATDLARAHATITQLELKLKNRDGESQLHPRH